MAYKLAELHGDTVAVPQLVLARLTQTDGNTMRAALYILQTGDTDPHTMARALGLPSVEAARRALQYWAGAGLLEKERGTAAAPAAEAPKKIDLAGLNDPYISVLCEESQTALGKALSRSELLRLVALYTEDGWQPDVILLCCAEQARRKHGTVAAVVRELNHWREDGVETGEDAERYLRKVKQREEWCADAAVQFGTTPDKLTAWERKAIARWHEEWGACAELIGEAILRAGDKLSVRYVDGILRSWRAQGITTVAAARGQGQLNGSNILTTARPAATPAAAQKDLFNRDWAAVFDEEG